MFLYILKVLHLAVRHIVIYVLFFRAVLQKEKLSHLDPLETGCNPLQAGSKPTKSTIKLQIRFYRSFSFCKKWRRNF